MIKDTNDIIIANLTTWPKRVKVLIEMLKTFNKNQTLHPDKIILWLSKEEFSKETIPYEILKLIEDKILTEIQLVEGNTYAHKKWETFKLNNNAYNVMIDDDLVYPPTFIEELYIASKKYNSPITYYGRNTNYKDNLRIYDNHFEELSYRNGLFSGLTIFPPKSFPLKSFKYSELRDEFCYRCDDSWINAWMLKDNKKIRVLHPWPSKNLNEIKGAYENSTWVLHNGVKNKNHTMLKVVNMANCAKILNLESKYKKIWPEFDIDGCADLQSISICITAFKNPELIKETLDSVIQQTWFKTHNAWEILLGIDADKTTLEYVKKIMCNYKHLKVFMLKRNVGTYAVTNLLMSLAKYDYLLRFDSDDIMYSYCIGEIMDKFKDKSIDIVRFKFDNIGNIAHVYRNGNYAIGQIAMKKEVFNKFKGYRSWRCSADADFIKRTKKFVKSAEIYKSLFAMRYVKNSLTNDPKTSLNSDYRKKYFNFINSHEYDKLNYAILKQIVIPKFIRVEVYSPFINRNEYITTLHSYDPEISKYKYVRPISTPKEIKHIKTTVLSKPATTQENTNRSFYNPYSRSVKTINTSALKNNRRYESFIKLLN